MNSNLPYNPLRRNVISLFIANGISFLIIGLSYAAYSRLLSPEEFGLYSIALVVGTFGVLILDGGLKNTIIKSSADLTKEEEGTLVFLMITSSILLLFVLTLVERPLAHFSPAIKRDYQFLALFGGLYLLSYPFMAIPTAKLERRIDYGRIAWVESIGLVLERGSPVFFLLWSREGIYSFFWGLLLGRLFRVICLNIPYRLNFFIPSRKQFRATLHLVTEGSWLQVATGSSLIRDNLHVLVVGPMFGKEWVGYYAWGLQLCLIASQIFVQISARVSLPLFAQAQSFENRWQTCLYQIRLLTMLTGPILVTILMVIPSIDKHFFQGKWQVAISFLPLLFIRMLPGLATTPIGTLLMVQKGGRAFASASILWTAMEVLSAGLLLFLLGPTGVAWSYAVVVWIGLLFFIIFLGKRTKRLAFEIIQELFQRPSLAISTIAVLILFSYYAAAGLNQNGDYRISLFLSIPILILAYLSESDVQRFFKIRL